MRHALLVTVLAVAACDTDTAKPAPEPTCEQLACAHVADCSPVQTGGVDWTSVPACLASGWACAEPEPCLDAVEALPCVSSPPTWEEIEANARAFTAVRHYCLGAPY